MTVRCSIFSCIITSLIHSLKVHCQTLKVPHGVLLESLAAAGNSHLYTSPNSMFIVMLVSWIRLWLECLYHANWHTMHIGAFFLENRLLNIYLCHFAPKSHAHTNTCSFPVFSVCWLNFLPLLRSQIDFLINRFAYHVFFSESLDTCLFHFSPGISISVEITLPVNESFYKKRGSTTCYRIPPFSSPVRGGQADCP